VGVEELMSEEKWYPGKFIEKVTKGKRRLTQEGPSQVIDLLDKAIKDEREAISFYNDAYSRISEPYEVARLFRELALEEQEHLKRLQEAKRYV
jgi:rubrerythrin